MSIRSPFQAKVLEVPRALSSTWLGQRTDYSPKATTSKFRGYDAPGRDFRGLTRNTVHFLSEQGAPWGTFLEQEVACGQRRNCPVTPSLLLVPLPLEVTVPLLQDDSSARRAPQRPERADRRGADLRPPLETKPHNTDKAFNLESWTPSAGTTVYSSVQKAGRQHS